MMSRMLFDNMPESIQYSERGYNMQEAIDNLDDSIGNIVDAIDNLYEAIEQTTSKQMEDKK